MKDIVKDDNVLSTLQRQKKIAEFEYREHVVMLCDVSGSMEEMQDDGNTKMEQLKKSLIKFNRDNISGKLHLLAFAGECIMPPGEEFEERVLNLRIMGDTKVVPGLEMSWDVLCAYPQVIHRRIILLTDGQFFDYPKSIWSTLATLRERNIRMDCIGFGKEDQVDEDLLREIAKFMKGEYQHADSLITLTQKLLTMTTERKLLT